MIHKYCMNGLYIVLDVNSGSVHAVDRIVYDALDYVETTPQDDLVSLLLDRVNTETGADPVSEEDIMEALHEITQLRTEGLLFSKNMDEPVPPSRREPVVKALCLHAAHACNLRCTYCFADMGDYGGHASLMSLETGKAAVDFLIRHSGSRKNLEIDFFGGEPLLNWETVREIMAYGREREADCGKTFRFTLTTNGVCLEEELFPAINKNMHNVVLSLDGRKETNDRMRKKADGQGSYEEIVPKLLRMAESRGHQNYYVRGTYTRNNLDFVRDVLHMAELGFKQISVEPVVADEKESYALRQEDLPVLFEQYETLAAEMLRRRKEKKEEFQFFHFLIDLSGGPCVYKRLSGCGAGTEYLAVTPEGELYPCHQFVGREEFKVGTLETGITNNELTADFTKCNLTAKKACRECWAKYYCGGGCAANAYFANGTISEPYSLGCELLRKRTECAIMLQVAAALEESGAFHEEAARSV